MAKIQHEKVSSKIYRGLNSAICFCIAYLLLQFGYQIFTALMSKAFGLSSVLTYSGVKIHLNKHRWGALNVFFVFSAGTFFLAMGAALFGYLFLKLKEKVFVFNLIFLWGFIIGVSMFFAQFIIPIFCASDPKSPFYQNLSVLFYWLNIPLFLIYLIAAIVAAGFVFLSTLSSKPFLTLSYSYSKVNKPARKRKYFLETVIAPFFVGAFIVLAFTFPLNVYINLIYLATIVASIVVSVFVINLKELTIDDVLRYKNLQVINIPVIVIAVVLMGLFSLIWRGVSL